MLEVLGTYFESERGRILTGLEEILASESADLLAEWRVLRRFERSINSIVGRGSAAERKLMESGE